MRLVITNPSTAFTLLLDMSRSTEQSAVKRDNEWVGASALREGT
ncbi:hypothetical protein Q2T83_03900 [Fervidibacter sacchari]|uniref:Uncharacterized protein n=1 Tax=Candidatus Fervidibacter sacchari TaxID=1448929 RepID=A0ABT2EPA7_9BACT|nr:hypothetical protein [Candidatus Fervidibacter sacchari]MCS3919789.1 hypothetical protein [Candidatus Fervidibacter sacchari]WKU16969.1 hypothetical protein Q2T83_03900 [Candidatus Fervidibacter sacchari]